MHLSILIKEGYVSGQWLTQKLTTILRAESQCLWSAQPQVRHLYHVPISQGLGTTEDEGAERPSETEMGRTGVK